jgi:phosphate ABC transporter permease subunit PstA
MIHVSDDEFDRCVRSVFNEAYMTHTSPSPNYQILASLDVGRRQVELEGFELVQKQVEMAMVLRERVATHPLLSKYFHMLSVGDLVPEAYRQSGIESYYDEDPLGVATAVYLEEFARKNRWTDLIEVNINNLAAVPSIVFGLLGLALFINLFGLPRSAPLVGGLVLSLMTLPVIIIASRAALTAVPPSIREAALGLGASKMQMVLHHVLPLALPGMLTGTIIGMARALGESAPLLMIGMVAFIVDIPESPLDKATALPVQVYLWADSPERAFVERTSAAIIVLLVFLLLMNLTAVLLRKRFERRY